MNNCVLCGASLGEHVMGMELCPYDMDKYRESPEYEREGRMPSYPFTGAAGWNCLNDYVRRVSKERQVAKELRNAKRAQAGS